jgi:hypothetical protein
MVWRFENGELHVGETIVNDGCTLPSLRYTYDDTIADKLNAAFFGDRCYIYSNTFPLLDVWEKYIDNAQTYAGCSWTNTTLATPQNVEIWHVRRTASFPFILRHSDEISQEQLVAAIKKSEPHDISLWEDFGEENIVKKTMDEFTAVYHKDLRYIDVFKDGKFQFRVNHNEYKSEHTCKIVHFFKTDDAKVLLLVNDNHSQLTVYNMENEEVASYIGVDDFYTDYYVVGDTIVLYGFIWSPVFFMKILSFKEILKDDSEYEGLFYHAEDKTAKGLVSPKVCLYKDDAYTPDEYIAIIKEEKEGERLAFIEQINELWTGNHMMKKVLRDQSAHTADLQELIDAKITSFTCKGGNSGSNFQCFCKPILVEDLVGKTWKDDFPNIIRNTPDSKLLDAIITMIYDYNWRGFTNRRYELFSLSQINLVYEINNEWRISFVIDMVPLDDKYFGPPQSDSDVKVTVTRISVGGITE